MINPQDLRGQSIYLDSNILIYGVEPPSHMPRLPLEILKNLFQDVQSGSTKAFTSQLTLSEALVLPLRENDRELEQTYRQLLKGTPHFPVKPVTLTILERSASLRAHYKGLKLADAVHLATAIESACDLFLTADKRLRQCEREIPISILDE